MGLTVLCRFDFHNGILTQIWYFSPDASISKGGDSAASAEQKQTSTPGAAAENNDTTDTQSRDENEAPNGEAEAADDSKPNARWDDHIVIWILVNFGSVNSLWPSDVMRHH